MKVFITVLVLIFSFQSWTKADDIRDFQIEGMSIGDSLLDFFGKNQINNFKNYDNLPSDMKFRIVEFGATSDFKIKKEKGFNDGLNVVFMTTEILDWVYSGYK